MSKDKQKVKLSENLRLGVAGPASQGTMFKLGGVFFLILSLVVGINITKDLKAWNPSHAIPAAQPPQVLGAYDNAIATPPNFIIYTIQKGDTLFDIAQHNNTSWQIIATLNNLKPPYNLTPGSTLKLPQAP